MAAKQWHIGSDMLIGVTGVKDAKTNEYDNQATVVFTLYDSTTEAAVANAVALPMVYDAASNGDYYGNLPAAVTATLERRSKYYMLITITGINYTLVIFEERPAEYYP